MTTNTTIITGAALLDLSWMDPTMVDTDEAGVQRYQNLIADALHAAYPMVEFCTHDELNTAVRGNHVVDVTTDIDWDRFTTATDDDLKRIIATS